VPLLRAGVIAPAGIVVNSFSGVSGAGKKVDEDYLFCERAESAQAYGIPKHRHLSEIEEQLSAAANAKVVIQFNPHLAPMRRGIATTIVAPALAKNTDAVYAAWRQGLRVQAVCANSPVGPDTRHCPRHRHQPRGPRRVLRPRTNNFVLHLRPRQPPQGRQRSAVQILNLLAGWPESDGLV